MPTYNYVCENCNEEQEVNHSIKEQPEVKCEKCNSLMKRCISKCSFVLKGGSWAKDNYK